MTAATGSPEQIERRLKDFEKWLDIFGNQVKYKDTIKPISNAAELLNQFYWKIVELYIRPLLGSRAGEKEEDAHHLINHFKIISIAELTVIAVLPFDVIDERSGYLDEEVNAKFAWFIALSIFSGWHPDIDTNVIQKAFNYTEILSVSSDGSKVDRAEYNFKKEHIQLLTTMDTKIQLPVLSNAQTWRMFYFTTLALQNKFS